MGIGTNIHPQAIVSQEAKLGTGVQIGAYAVVGADVELGDGCVLKEHAVVRGPSKFGAKNVFHPFCVIGGDPQDYSFRGERVELQVAVETFFASMRLSAGGRPRAAASRASPTTIFSWHIRTSVTTARSAATRCS